MAQNAADIAAERAATKAAERVSSEAMDSFNKFQQNNNPSPQNIQPVEKEVVEDEPETELFDKATANSITKTVRAYESLQRVFTPPPDPTRTAIDTAISGLLSDFVTTRLGGGGNSSVVSKSSLPMQLLKTVLDSQFGANMGARVPEIITALSSSIGEKKTQELIENVNAKMNSTNNGTGNVEPSNSNENAEKQKDMILALDVNNPEHIKQYAQAMGLSEKAAKGMLQIHQDDILTERKTNKVGNQGSVGNIQGNNEITQALTILIQEMSGMKETINSLNTKIINIEGKRIPDENVNVTVQSVQPDTDSKWEDENEQAISNKQSPISVTQKSVNLFSTPIKVDVDSIKGDSDPFFSKSNSNANVEANSINKKLKVEKESVLEEVIDDEGNSSFRMSDEKEQPKPLIEKTEKVVEKEEDKKKESNSDELVDDEPKIEENVVRKKVIRKPIPVIEVQESSPSEERYDINNNLIV